MKTYIVFISTILLGIFIANLILSDSALSYKSMVTKTLKRQAEEIE